MGSNQSAASGGGHDKKLFIKGASGRSKTKNEIKDHKQLRKQLFQRQYELHKLKSILSDLKEDYITHKHHPFFYRYSQMKRTIKSSVDRLQQVVDEMQSQATKLEDGVQGSARKLADNSKKLVAQEKYYSDLSAEQMATDLINFPAQIQQLEEEFLMKRSIIEQLGTDYENSKNLIYHKRYKDLKRMIKGTFSAQPNNNQHQ